MCESCLNYLHRTAIKENTKNEVLGLRRQEALIYQGLARAEFLSGIFKKADRKVCKARKSSKLLSKCHLMLSLRRTSTSSYPIFILFPKIIYKLVRTD